MMVSKPLTAAPETIDTSEDRFTLAADEMWSYSRLSTAERCMRSFYHKYIEKRPTPGNMPMIIGKIFHRSIEWMLKEGYEPAEALRFSIYEAGGLPEGEEYRTLLHMIENARYRIPQDVEIQSEVHLKLKTTLGTIQAYLDLVLDDPAEDCIEIWDYKSGWVKQEAEESMQIAFYGWLYSEIRGTAMGGDFKGRIVLPRMNKDTEVQLTHERLLEAKNWFIRMVNEIQSKSLDMNDWEQTSSRKNCEYCPFVGLCASDMMEQGFPASGEVMDKEEAERMGAYILLQELLIKKLKKGMKTFVEEHEPVQIGDKSWHINESIPSPKVEDMIELMAFALENGLEVTQAMKADADKIQEWLDADESGKLEQLVTWTNPRKTLKFGKTAVATVVEETVVEKAEEVETPKDSTSLDVSTIPSVDS